MGDLAELTVIRHGESVANAAVAAPGALEYGIAGPDADVELSPLGRRQAAMIGRWLDGHRPDVVICSPYRRAIDTWMIASGGGAHLVDDRLCDRRMGDLQMLTRAGVAARFPAEAARLRAEGEYAYRPPGGESFGDVADRLALVLSDLRRDHAGRRVLLVAHDAVVLMLRRLIERLSFDAIDGIWRADRPANAAITRFDGSSGTLRLAGYNDRRHLG